MKPGMDLEEALNAFNLRFKNFITALINYPKIIIALVNGPAIGIGVTLLGLCDAAYASNTATFRTPFIKLGLCAEGTSSYLLPRILGRSLATELLFFNRELTAEEALRSGLISRIIPSKELPKFYVSLFELGKLPLESLRRTKRLINYELKEHLHKVNEEECKELRESLNHEDFHNALAAFMSRKSKL